MPNISVLRLLMFALAIFGSAGVSWAQVEYVRICDRYGPGFFYIPGTETCLNPTTGATKMETPSGTSTTPSKLLQRVQKLESNECDDCFAVVGSDGTMLNSQGVSKVKRTERGVYVVTFKRRIASCAHLATIGSSIGEAPGVITVQSQAANKAPATKILTVRTFNMNGALANRGFHIATECREGPIN